MAAGTSRSLPLAQARKQGKVAARRADGRGRSLEGNLANRRYRRGTDLFRPGLTAGPPSPEGEGYFWTLCHLPHKSEFVLHTQKTHGQEILPMHFYYRSDYLLSAARAFAAVRPETKISTMALPPRRLPPWMPPVTSPAAYRPGMTLLLVSIT